VVDPLKTRRFEQVVMPHVDAAYIPAYGPTRSEADARVVVREARLRAFKCFDRFSGDHPAAWLLTIARRSCYTWLRRDRAGEESSGFVEDEEDGGRGVGSLAAGALSLGRDPETQLIAARDNKRLHELIASRRTDHREVVVLRELQELSYRDIAQRRERRLS
jgi:RNA polymerase sigma factor (sigma-70 family)